MIHSLKPVNNFDIITIINIFYDAIQQFQCMHDLNIIQGDAKPTNLCNGNLSSIGSPNF